MSSNTTRTLRRSTRKKSNIDEEDIIPDNKNDSKTAAVVSPSPSSLAIDDAVTSSVSAVRTSQRHARARVRAPRISIQKNNASKSLVSNSDIEEDDDDSKVVVESKRVRKKVCRDDKKSLSTSRAFSGARSRCENSQVENDTGSDILASPYFDKKRKRVSESNSPSILETLSPQQVEATIQAAREDLVCQPVNDSWSPGTPNGNGGLYHPFYRVEYSMTGRATCRRCDMRIEKDDVRVGHRPLFRGKPGFVIYRHLGCAVFDKNVQNVEDIGGLSDLNEDDKERLALRLEESKQELEKEQEIISPDELVNANLFEGEIRNSPLGLNADLLPFQVKGVSWMYAQETKEEVRGGILADEMGMGKTLQTITVMLDNKPNLQHYSNDQKRSPDFKSEEDAWKQSYNEWATEMEKSNVLKTLRPKDGPLRAGTLVVCPISALDQWKQEIEKFTKGSALTVGIYHGQKRTSSLPRKLLCKYDVVLTTYQVIEADFRKMASPNKVKCPNCGKKFKIDRLKLHLKYYCGEYAERTEAQARQIRTSERATRSNNNSGNSNMNKSNIKEKVKSQISRNNIRIKSRDGMDSESELSRDSLDKEMTSKSTNVKVTRTAAKNASKKISTFKMISGEDTDSSFSVTMCDDDEYSSGSISPLYAKPEKLAFQKCKRNRSTRGKEAKAQTKRMARKNIPISSDGSSNKSETELNTSVIESQRKAFERARFGRKGKKTRTLNMMKVTKKKKLDKGNKNSNDVSDDFDCIDMNRLIKEAQANSCMSILHSLCWWRIVLDEAHMIKSRSSQTAASAFALIGIHRWCLSGTPLQNRVGEFYSLVRFLRIDPMAHYFCRAKSCTCKSLHYRMFNGKCQDCDHGSVQHYSQFNKYILNPIKRDGYSGDGRRAMFTLKNEVLDKCLLRRTKATNASDMKLPNRVVKIREVNLHPIEEDFYNSLYTKSKTTFNDYAAQGNLLNNYAHVFDLLIRLRQAVNHPYLVLFSKNGMDTNGELTSEVHVANGSVMCGLCSEDPTDRVLSSCCSNAFCRVCVLDYMSTAEGLGDGENGIPCPSCRSPFSIDLSSQKQDDDGSKEVACKEQKATLEYNEGMPLLNELSHVPSNSVLKRVNLAEFATSTKIEALTEELVKMRKTSPGSKAIVFSQFVNMLDLIRWRLHSDPCLKDMGLGVASLHGGMNVKVREEKIRSFKEDSDIRVLLVSLKTGGVALNLTVANYIFLMDPWWNPAAEMQAIDRTHRIGQYRPIRAVRFIASNTVESRILQLQEKKRLVFDGTVGRDAASLTALTSDDMTCLFS